MYNLTGNKPILHKSIFHKSLPIAFALIILTFAIANAYALAPSPPLSISSITPTTPTLDNGQSITITGTWSGGTAPYNAVWYTGPKGTTCPQETANVIATYNGLSATSNSITVSPTTTNSYCLGITDSESPAVTQLSLNYTLNPIMSGTSDLTDIAISPSGTYAYVTNEYANNVVIINTATNTVVNSITSGFNFPVGVSFSPSGTYAYVANFNSNNVVIINTATNTVVNSITSGISGPEGVSFSPSGTYAYAVNNANVVIINTATNTVVNSIISGFSGSEEVAISPSGTYAYVANLYSSNVVIINTATNTVSGSINSGFNEPEGVAFSPSGAYAYVTNVNGDNVIIINPGIGAEITNLIYSSVVVNPELSANSITPSNPGVDAGKPITLMANPSGGTTPYSYKWYTISGTGGVTCTSANVISGATSQIYSTIPTSTNSYAYQVTDSATNSVSLCSANDIVTVNPDLSVPTIIPSNPKIDSGQSITFSSIWSGGTPDYTASLYSSPTSTCNQQSALVQQDINLQSNSVTFSPVSTTSGTYYCIFVADNTLNSYSIPNSIINVGQNPEGIAISPSGAYAYVTNFYGSGFSLNGNITVINLATDSISKRITTGFYLPFGISFSPSGTYAYVANYGSNNVVIINTATNTVTASILSGFNEPEGVAFSPSGAYAYVTNFGSNNVVIINTASNAVTGSITSGFYSPYGVSFSLSGTYAYVANGNSDNVVIINTATNAVTTYIKSGLDFPYGVAFSPSGTYAYVVNAGSNNVVIINTGTSITNSIASEAIVNQALSAPTISPLNTTINNGQSVTFSSIWSGGTIDYTAKLYSSATSICNTGSTLVQTISSLTTGSTAFNPVTPTATTYYCVLITDSATIPVTVNSINSEVTLKSSGPQISNPYAGGPTGYFGPNSTLTSSTTSITTSSTTSTILPVTTIAPIIASSGTTKVCNDTSGYTVNYPSLNATIKIVPESGCFSLTVTNSTLQSKKLNRSVITALNYTVNNTNVSADATLHYSCSIPNSDVAPFILRNGTWHEITPFTLNVAACTVEFAVPSDPVIALLNTNITSTITTTTAISTVQTSVPTTPLTQQSNNTTLILILIIIVIIVIAALFIYLRNRR